LVAKRFQALTDYEPIVGKIAINQLRQLADDLTGMKVVHVNSTKIGGGVAEILEWMVPLMQELGIQASWETIEGDQDFFNITKMFHNGLQGNPVEFSAKTQKIYESTNVSNLHRLQAILEDADSVFIHDPQPAFLLKCIPHRKGKWIWRCHIDVSSPNRLVWKYLKGVIEEYDASIFSMVQFAQSLKHPQFVIAPSIDPLSEKNCELSQSEINDVYSNYNLDPNRPIIVQISRFDRFKDPLGVISAYKYIKDTIPIQLVLAGGAADDDPEGAKVLNEVLEAAANDPDIHVLLLPGDAHRTINALQRIADIIIQKSIKEGFGLTVTEGLWKGRPVIGGDTGGIRLQVINHHTGFLVKTPQGAALRIRYLLHQRDIAKSMGIKAKELVRENFLLTRHLREYLTLLLWLKNGNQDNFITA
jgi:trehalose synthase